MKSKLLLIIIIITILIICGCINSNDQKGKDTKFFQINYEISISNLNNSSYKIQLPLPVYSNGSIVQKIINHIETSDNLSYFINQSIKGPALEIITNDNIIVLKSNIEIKWIDSYSKEPSPIRLSMSNDYEKPNGILISEQYWIYSSNSNLTLTIKFNSYPPGGGEYSYISSQIMTNEGWQIVKIQEHIEVV